MRLGDVFALLIRVWWLNSSSEFGRGTSTGPRFSTHHRLVKGATSRDAGKARTAMPHQTSLRPDLVAIPILPHETLYVGVDIGKLVHVAGFVSPTLLSRHQRFEHCPALSFENSREGFRALVDRIRTYVPLTQVYVVRCQSQGTTIGSS